MGRIWHLFAHPIWAAAHGQHLICVSISDISLSINGDCYLIEAQISDDLEIALRAFQYAFAIAKDNRTISKNGSLIELELPEPRIIYFENENRTPDVVTLKIKYPRGKFKYEIPTFKVLENPISEFEKKHLDLLLPFYFLKFRRNLKKKNVGSEKGNYIRSLPPKTPFSPKNRRFQRFPSKTHLFSKK